MMRLTPIDPAEATGVIETVANVALNALTCHVNSVAQADIDFPKGERQVRRLIRP